MVTIEKCEFGQLNDKIFILRYGISSFPCGHKDLKFIENFKDEISLTPEKLIKYHKDNLLRFEQGILQSNKRVRIINSVLFQQPVFYKRGALKMSNFRLNPKLGTFCCLVYGRKYNISVMANPQTKLYLCC